MRCFVQLQGCRNEVDGGDDDVDVFVHAACSRRVLNVSMLLSRQSAVVPTFPKRRCAIRAAQKMSSLWISKGVPMNHNQITAPQGSGCVSLKDRAPVSTGEAPQRRPSGTGLSPAPGMTAIGSGQPERASAGL